MLYLSNGSRDQKKSTSLALKFVKDGVMNERSRKISFMLWRCEKCGEFRLQQVEQSARVFVFAEVTTTR